MLAQRGRACARHGCLWSATKEVTRMTSVSPLHCSIFHKWPAAADEATSSFRPWHSKGFHSRQFAVTSVSTVTGARSFAQSSVIATVSEDEEEDEGAEKVQGWKQGHNSKQSHDTKERYDGNQARDTRLIQNEQLEEEYMTRLEEALDTSNGSAAWRTALNIFHEIQQSKGRGLSFEVASFLVEVLGARNCVADCIKVLAYARAQGIRPRIQAYSSAVGCCYREEQFGHALRVFEVMRNDGYLPQTVTYSHALSSALKSNQHELVLEIFDDMIKHQLEMNIIVYNNILNSCARAADVHSAMGVLRAINEQQLTMTQSTYHSLAICAGKTGKWELALDAMNMMQTNGFEPTATIYNSVFSACAKGKQWDTVVEVYDCMPEDLRESLRGVYLGSVVMGHAKAESEELKLRALEIFHKYRARQSEDDQPNFFAYNAALIALLGTNQLEKIHPLANEMKKQGMKWDTVTYQCLILAYIRGGAVETAVQMLQKNAKRMEKTTLCYREAIEFYDEKRKNPREAVRLTMQMMQMNKRLSRLDWHNALRIALELPERAPYWNFRKWMNIRAKGIMKDVPSHLMLPNHAEQQRALLHEDGSSQEPPERKHHQDNYHSRKRQLNRRKPNVDDEKFL